MNAVQLVDEEILSSPQPLPNAIINFFLKAGRTMGKGWVSHLCDRCLCVLGYWSVLGCAECAEVWSVLRACAEVC